MNKWIYYNSNPLEKRVGDCAIRACCKATGRTWNEVFDDLVQIAYRQKDVLSANKVWGEYLADNGYVRYEHKNEGFPSMGNPLFLCENLPIERNWRAFKWH